MYEFVVIFFSIIINVSLFVRNKYTCTVHIKMKFASIFSKQISKLAKSQSKQVLEEKELLIETETIVLSDEDEPVIVIDIEPTIILRSATECDPALASREFTISDKPIRPLIKFPTTNKRKFLKSWYSDHAWFEYSIAKDAAFCFSCRKFCQSNADAAFVSIGMKKPQYENIQKKS